MAALERKRNNAVCLKLLKNLNWGKKNNWSTDEVKLSTVTKIWKHVVEMCKFPRKTQQQLSLPEKETWGCLLQEHPEWVALVHGWRPWFQGWWWEYRQVEEMKEFCLLLCCHWKKKRRKKVLLSSQNWHLE